MRDERFVRALCGRLDVPLTVRDFDVAAYRCQHGVSVEMACRELRYAWFEQERQRQGCASSPLPIMPMTKWRPSS